MVSANINFTFAQNDDREVILEVHAGAGWIEWNNNDITHTNPSQIQYSHTYTEGGGSIVIHDLYLYRVVKAPTLTSIILMQDIPTYLLGYNSGILTNQISIVNGVQTINYAALQGQSLITQLVIPPSVLNIGTSALEGMTALTTVVFQETVPPLFNGPGSDHTPFKDCPNLTTIYVPDGSVNAYKTAIPSRANIIQGVGYTDTSYIEINDHVYKIQDEQSRQDFIYLYQQIGDNAEALRKTHASLTQAQYDTLTEAQKNNGTEYFITDAIAEGDFSNLESRLLKMESNFIDVSPNVTIVDPARYKSMTKVDANTVEIIVNDPVTTKDYKITVTASGSGNTRTNPQYTIEEVI